MKLSEFIKWLNEDSNIQVEDPEISIQLPPGTLCYEKNWSQFEIGCFSDDGGTIYIQCERNPYYNSDTIKTK